MLIVVGYRTLYGARRWEPFLLVIGFTLVSFALALPWGEQSFGTLYWPKFVTSVFVGKVCLAYLVYAVCRYAYKRPDLNRTHTSALAWVWSLGRVSLSF
jgi:hypothetical protein